MIYKKGDKFTILNATTGVLIPNEIVDIKYEMKRAVHTSKFISEEKLNELLGKGRAFAGTISPQQAEIRALELKYNIKLEVK